MTVSCCCCCCHSGPRGGHPPQVTPPDKSLELIEDFKRSNPTEVFAHEHGGGHVIPEVSLPLQQQLQRAVRQATGRENPMSA